MKYSNILFIVILAFLSACNSEKEVIIDFSGTYKGQLDCEGALDNSMGEEVIISITQFRILKMESLIHRLSN